MNGINPADTVFVLVSAAMVLFMTPGLALFYSGMVRRKNVLSVTMQSFFALGLIGVLWAVIGYTLAFGSDKGGWIGGLENVLLIGSDSQTYGAPGHLIPLSAFMMFQAMFAIIAAALISGAIVERMKFKAYVIFIAAWSLLIYSPLAHWIWGGGWLQKLGVLDFAGGIVIHIAAGASALAACVAVGVRRGWHREEMAPHSLPLTVFGVGVLWFGWFGFNAGSALAVGTLASSTFLATAVAGMAGVFAWTFLEWLHRGKPTTLGAASGAVAGLGTVTGASGYVNAPVALAIGLVAGIVCYFAITLKDRLGYDDSLDVVGVHGVGGTIGILAAGLVAGVASNPSVHGLFTGDPSQLWKQALGALVGWVFCFVGSFLILKVIDVTIGLRADPEIEVAGLDIAEHAETAYVL
jgi:ammonium transporter, Amt family